MRPLAAAFLSGLIRHVRASVIRRRPDLKQRPVNWFVNVGVPVQHYDENMDAFREVGGYCLSLVTARLDEMQCRRSQIRLRSICWHSRLQVFTCTSSCPNSQRRSTNCIRDPNREDTLYGLVDIGGGTVDGAIFHVNRSGIGRPLRIHAARVDQCGTIAVSRMMVAEIFSKLSDYVEGALVSKQDKLQLFNFLLLTC